VTMGQNQDQRSKALLYSNGFQNQDQVSEFVLMQLEYSRENPAYDPSLDFSVLTAEGIHVATVVGFVDPANRAAEVEKICSHNQYRRQGLAEAVIRECFHHLSRRGIERAYIQGYSGEANRLYEKLGPCKHKQWFSYELKKE
jgi:ribosomal protein S18 acetylase RimI-like enzyme